MTKRERDSYSEMSPEALRRWLVRSCVAAGSMAAALLVIGISYSGRGPGPDMAGGPPTTQVTSASDARR